MRFLILISLLFVLSVAAAEETELTIFEQKDFGPPYEEDFDEIEVTMECDKATIYIQIEDEDVPITGAVVRIVYIDYSTPLLASGPTDAEGEFDYTLIGERDFMRGLFLVVVEKEGYKQKEAHFDISNCLDQEEEPDAPLIEESTPPKPIPEPEPEEPEPPPVIPPTESEPETEPEPIPEPEENITNATDSNVTGNITTGETEGPKTEYLCVSSFIFLLAAALVVLYH